MSMTNDRTLAAKLRFAAERSDAPAYNGDMTLHVPRTVIIAQFLVYTTFYVVDRQSKPLLLDFERVKVSKRVYGPMPVLYSLLPY
jgi:hypothetical protein